MITPGATANPGVTPASTGQGAGNKAVIKEYEAFFSESLGPITTTIGLVIGLVLLGDLELGAELGMLPEEVDGISGPLARIAERQKLKPKVRKAILSSGDYVAIASILVVYGSRVLAAIQEKGRIPNNVQPIRPAQAENDAYQTARAGAAAPSNGHVPSLSREGFAILAVED